MGVADGGFRGEVAPFANAGLPPRTGHSAPALSGDLPKASSTGLISAQAKIPPPPHWQIR
jgi:hypothetical protein